MKRVVNVKRVLKSEKLNVASCLLINMTQFPGQDLFVTYFTPIAQRGVSFAIIQIGDLHRVTVDIG